MFVQPDWLHNQPRGADGQILQKQRCQRPLAALILKWLGNGHGSRFILGLTPLGDVFQEDKAEVDVLVFRGVHVPAHLVGSGPKLGFEVEGGAVGGFLGFCHAGTSLCG